MRILVLLAAACGSSRAPTPTPRPTALPLVLDAAADAPAPTAYLGRVAIVNGSWTDVTIAGTGAAAHALCDRLLELEQLSLRRIPELTLEVRACALLPLPARPGGRVLLVETEPVDQDSMTLENLLADHSDVLLPAQGELRRVLPMDDRAQCEARKQRQDEDDAGIDAEMRRDDATRSTRVRAEIEAHLGDVCGRLAAGEQACARMKGDKRKDCQRSLAPTRVACDDLTRRRGELADGQQPQSLPSKQRRCESAPLESK